MDTIKKRPPDIGKVVEKIVAEANVSAYKWQWTGVYTYLGETKKEKQDNRKWSF